MASIFRDISGEIADNWPAFIYILMMVGFSVLFFRERLTEARDIRQMGERLQESILARFDRLERAVHDLADRPQTERQTTSGTETR